MDRGVRVVTVHALDVPVVVRVGLGTPYEMVHDTGGSGRGEDRVVDEGGGGDRHERGAEGAGARGDHPARAVISDEGAGPPFARPGVEAHGGRRGREGAGLGEAGPHPAVPGQEVGGGVPRDPEAPAIVEDLEGGRGEREADRAVEGGRSGGRHEVAGRRAIIEIDRVQGGAISMGYRAPRAKGDLPGPDVQQHGVALEEGGERGQLRGVAAARGVEGAVDGLRLELGAGVGPEVSAGVDPVLNAVGR